VEARKQAMESLVMLFNLEEESAGV
jgi:hypothetical protein